MQETVEPRWEPLSAIDRRVIGVLVEKAKTTPDAYPLTVNSLRNGCNQKSNRSPLVDYQEEQIVDSLERLRGLGAVTEVQDSGRALKYRHRMYEWLGVDKAELAVMAELLLRGEQSVGELRGRAARMEPIADMAALRPILDRLREKELVQYFTPEGRGAILSHTLYLPQELDKVRARARDAEMTADASSPAARASSSSPAASASAPASPGTAGFGASAPAASPSASPASAHRGSDPALAQEVAALRTEVGRLRAELEALRTSLENDKNQVAARVDEICRQLGIP